MTWQSARREVKAPACENHAEAHADARHDHDERRGASCLGEDTARRHCDVDGHPSCRSARWTYSSRTRDPPAAAQPEYEPLSAAEPLPCAQRVHAEHFKAFSRELQWGESGGE